ncbi:MAG: hypothetical protein ACI93S_001644 [Ancylomarina sp.]|jgi:hypothetical protein
MRKVILFLIIVSITSLAIGQDKYINRDIRPNMSLEKPKVYTIDFFNGVSFPQGDLNDFLRNGFNSGILFHKNFSNKLSLGLSVNHSRFNYKQSFVSIQGSSRQELSTTSFDIGPQYDMKLGRFSIEFYGRSGLSIVNSPQSSMMYPETDITITTLETYKSTALTARLGANMTAHIFDGLDFYFSSEYLTSINSEMNYQTRNLSEAIREDGTLDSDLANELPYSNESFSLSMLNVNIGVRISIGSNSNKRKSNSLYKASGNSARNPISEGLGFQYNPDKINVETRGQNSNLNRSNNSSSAVPNTDNGKGDLSDTIQTKGEPSQNHHISRGNNSSIIAPSTDESETRLNSESKPADEATLADISAEKLKLKTKAQLAKERRKKKRIKRRLKRLKAKL